MNRILKFRLIKNGEIVGWERHILTYPYVVTTKCIVIQYSEDGKTDTPFDDNWTCEKIVHDDKEQYIGKRDSAGKEICEGDIMEFYSAMVEKGTNPIKRVVVKWNNNYLRFENCFNGGKIIGNIHGNKNLIEK